MKHTLFIPLMAALLTLAGPLSANAESAQKKVAIFVANRAEASLNEQAPVFEDMLTARITGLGYQIISREMVMSAVGDLLQTSQQNELDAMIDDQTSALRLAQNLGADYLLLGTILGMDTESRTSTAYGIQVKNQTHTLRASYRVLSGVDGSALAAGTVSPSRSIQQSANSTISTPGLVRELMDRASSEIAGKLRMQEEAGSIASVKVEDELVSFGISVTLNDVNFPEIVVGEDGKPRVTSNTTTVQATSVSVELDGITVGTTGDGSSRLQATPGLHRLRLFRDDLIPFERMVNIREGMQLNIPMDLNESGRDRWLQDTILVNDLKNEALITDATAEQIRGMAEALRQSGYKVDIKVDTDEAMTIENNQSLMQQN